MIIIVLFNGIRGTYGMIREFVPLPDSRTRVIKYPSAERNLGRRHTRHHIQTTKIVAGAKIHTMAQRVSFSSRVPSARKQ